MNCAIDAAVRGKAVGPGHTSMRTCLASAELHSVCRGGTRPRFVAPCVSLIGDVRAMLSQKDLLTRFNDSSPPRVQKAKMQPDILRSSKTLPAARIAANMESSKNRETHRTQPREQNPQAREVLCGH